MLFFDPSFSLFLFFIHRLVLFLFLYFFSSLICKIPLLFWTCVNLTDDLKWVIFYSKMFWFAL